MDSTNPRISVIVPVKDAADVLPACLQGLAHQEEVGTYETIVVDDGSIDDSAEVARIHGVRVISQANTGPAAARNLGARHARGEILAFTDADCVPDPKWLFHLTQPFEHPEVVGTRGVYRTQQTGLVPRFVQQEYMYKYRRMAKLSRIDFIDTYSAAYRRKVFLENGGFQVAFPLPSVEDQELSFRLARKGYLLKFVPQAVVYHIHDQNVIEYWKRKFGIGYWKAYLLRWLPEKTLADTHTPATQRVQIILLGTGFLSLLLAGFFKPFGWLALSSFLLFYLSAVPILLHILRNDSQVVAVAPFLLLLRAAALGSGLLWGWVNPPKSPAPVVTGIPSKARVAKRLLDIVGAGMGLILSAPIIAFSALAIKLDSSGPVFFKQERVGENGRMFRIVKLRTMVVGAERRVAEVLTENPLEGPVFKIPGDPRITRIGRFLRRWSLDELPQFWNVLKGEMSLVGPRPEEAWVVAQYNDRQRLRLVVKPGITGPMQVSGRGELDMESRLRLELEYIQKYSIWKDIELILRTIPAIISGKGAF